MERTKRARNLTEVISADEFLQFQRKRNKFGAIKVKDDGYTFDSKAEHRRYCELKLLSQAGKISHLIVHPKYDLIDCKYIGDFLYRELDDKGGFKVVMEDVKSKPTLTRISQLKMKILKRMFPDMEVRIVGLDNPKKKARSRYRNCNKKPKCT